MQNETLLQKLNDAVKVPRPGDIINGTVLAIENLCIYLDIGPAKTGVIYGSEYQGAKNILKNLKIGDPISVKVVTTENEDGFVELSLKEAARELAWQKVKEVKESKEPFVVKIEKVNKGGLITQLFGFPAFLPTSQLSSVNYPRVPEGDKVKILRKLQSFIGKEFEVKVLDFDEKEGQIILTEDSKEAGEIEDVISKVSVGDVVEGTISGIVNFGVFMKINIDGKEVEGLVHISELDWQLIEDPAEIIQIGETVKAEVIDVSQGRISLSIKKLKEDPWKSLNYKVGDIIKGKILKLNSFGAFVQVLRENVDNDNSKIQGLIHVSEFGTEKKMQTELELNKEYDFKILSFQPERHWMSLKLIKK
ncbi:MAG TPA: S1 RNA-binding domain-containing protein [Candidatus Pacearchaeota archaeon]|nr:S1 RNA-binding domain-containing protein [Candidatus Pacearchaeota archaeon]